MAKKFAWGLTNLQIDFARALERAGITTFSQVVKAFSRDDSEQIREWEILLAEHDSKLNK